MNKSKYKSIAKNDLKSKIIRNKVAEIESLKHTVSELQISCDQKDELIRSIEHMREDMMSVIDDIKKNSERYDELVSELMEMKRVMNQVVFKGRWKLVKWLLK